MIIQILIAYLQRPIFLTYLKLTNLSRKQFYNILKNWSVTNQIFFSDSLDLK
jgi:hypothetical protein